MIALQDDGCLCVYDSPAAAAVAVEGLDAEETFRAVFDENGVPYRIEWLRPNEAFRFGGVQNGEYRLVPAGPADRQAMAEMIRASDAPAPVEIAALVGALRLG